MSVAIDHINIVVRDLSRMVGFYRDVLGLTITKDVTIRGKWIEDVVGLKDVEARVIYLSPPAPEAPEGPRIELIEYQSPKSLEPGPIDQAHAYGLRHMAFRVDDIDIAAQRLRAAGVKLFSDVQKVPDAQVTYQGGLRKRLVYFHDPEGNLLEFCEYKA